MRGLHFVIRCRSLINRGHNQYVTQRKTRLRQMNEGEEFSTHLIVNTLPFFFLPLLLCKGAKNKREGVWASFHFCYLYLEG